MTIYYRDEDCLETTADVKHSIYFDWSDGVALFDDVSGNIHRVPVSDIIEII